MKKIFSFAMAAVLLMAGCVKDDLSLNGNDGKVQVTFTAELPIEVSRAEVGDGTKADVVKYAIYGTDGVLFDGYNYQDLEVKGKTATLTLDLVKGQSYKIAFWAQNSSAPYTFDRVAKTVVADYSGKDLSNDEIYDAFYAVEPITVAGPDMKTVTLRRPFAQINLGATKDDVTKAKALGVEIDQSTVTLTGVHTTLNIFDGTLGAATTDVEFEWNTLPGNDLKVKEVYYAYLAANYILAESEADVTDLSFSIKDGDKVINTVKVPAVNYKRNYRTNILGRLLTSSVDFNIVIDGTPYGDIGQTWDGSTIAKPGIDDAGNYVISNAEQLAWFANAVNGTLPATASLNSTRAGEDPKADSFKGKTVKLASDISLNGKEWTPIGVGSNRFSGKFDGQGHTISNFKISTRHGAGQAALFGNTSLTVEFRDLTLEKVNVACPDYAGDYYGAALIGTMYGNVTIENVYVKDSYISGNNKVGALVAHDGVCSSLHIKDCHVSGVTFEALNVDDSGSVGGLVGFFQGVAKGSQAEPYGTHIIEQSSVNNCVFNVINSTNSGKRSNALLIGGINSKAGQELHVNDCSAQGNTWNEKFYVNGVEVTAGTFVSPYGELIGGDRNDAPKGKVFIDGKEIIALTPVEGAEGVALDADGNYYITANQGLASLSALVAADDDGFAGKTIILHDDVDLAAVKTNGDSFAPIGSTGERDDRNRVVCKPFKGTFDGNGKTISNLQQSGWDFGYEWGQYGSLGLFAELESATVKNVVLEGLVANVEGGDISFIAGSATGDCVFEDITITNSKIGTYNNGCGGIIGWSGAGTYTFKNIKLGSDVVLGGLWGSFDSSIGGIVGQAEPGATYNFENVEINCRIDAYNDCTASYDYYLYRMCGMIIGRCEETTTINGSNYPDLSKYNMSFKNVVVNYGTWMNYHYCEPTPGHNNGRGMRVEPGHEYGGLPADFDHSQCTINHYSCIPFDQLIGGNQLGVRGLREVDGVTVNYPAEYTCPLCGQQHNVK